MRPYLSALKQAWYPFILILLVAFSNYGGDYRDFKWVSLSIILCAYYAYRIGVRFHLSLGLALFSTLLSSIYTGFFRLNHYRELSWLDTLAFDKVTIQAAFYCLLLPFPFLFLSRKSLDLLKTAFIYFALLNSVFTLFTEGHGGLIGNPSMNGCLLACTLPLMLGKVPLKVLALPIFAILLTGTSIPFLVLLSETFIYLWVTKSEWVTRKELTVLSATGFMGGVIFIPQFLSGSGRFELWTASYYYFISHMNVWFGAGTGLSQNFLPYIYGMMLKPPLVLSPSLLMDQTQSLFLTTRMTWTYFHSDWLQLIFEQGLIGLMLYLTFFIVTVRRALHNPALFTSLIGYTVMALFNYPAHFSLHAVFGLLLLALIFEKKAPSAHT